MKNIIKSAALNACGAALYIVVVASLMFNASKIFGNDNENTILIPIAMLLLFVFSAALTGILIFGRPVIWYLNDRKEDAVSLLMATLAILFIITLVAFFGLFLYFRF